VQEYAQRWREKVAQVESPLLKKEMTNLFSNMFKAPFFDYLVSAPTQHSTDIMIMAEQIATIKVGKIVNLIKKKRFIGKKKDRCKQPFKNKLLQFLPETYFCIHCELLYTFSKKSTQYPKKPVRYPN
jgi:hypothetical protein